MCLEFLLKAGIPKKLFQGSYYSNVGHNWDITAVRVDPTGEKAPYYLPQGLATMFYSLHHGDRLLAVEHGPLPSRPQPYIVGKWTKWPETVPTVADVDLLVTADDGRGGCTGSTIAGVQIHENARRG